MIARVTARRLGKRYGDARALVDVEIDLLAGEVTCVLGHNGAGKSTLVGILSTLTRPTMGSVTYRTTDGATLEGPNLRREIGLLAHASLCYGELSAEENLRFFAGLYEVSDIETRVTELLDRVGIETSARHRPARTYSRGMWQRLALARALIARPSLLLLDEPFTGLDRGGALALGEQVAQLKSSGTIVVVVTHDLEAIAGLTDAALVLRGGKVVHASRTTGADYADLRALYEAHAA